MTCILCNKEIEPTHPIVDLKNGVIVHLGCFQDLSDDGLHYFLEDNLEGYVEGVPL